MGLASFKCDHDLDKIIDSDCELWITKNDDSTAVSVKFVDKHRVTGEFIFSALNKETAILDGEYTLMHKGVSYNLLKQNQEFYYLHNGQYVGNAMLWWRQNGAGYTTNIDEAHKFTREEAYNYHRARKTDVPWNADHVDAKALKVADRQYLDTKNILR